MPRYAAVCSQLTMLRHASGFKVGGMVYHCAIHAYHKAQKKPRHTTKAQKKRHSTNARKPAAGALGNARSGASEDPWHICSATVLVRRLVIE